MLLATYCIMFGNVPLMHLYWHQYWRQSADVKGALLLVLGVQ